MKRLAPTPSAIIGRMPNAGRSLPEKEPGPLEGESYERPWAVFIHNDETTPMDFVIHILSMVFQLSSSHAAQVMYTAHINGKAFVQALPRTEALRRVGQARFAARLRGYPLEFSVESE
jgi:ATP-dependent Clp protease adapter protein ClpS